jgi:hypothetical protein
MSYKYVCRGRKLLVFIKIGSLVEAGVAASRLLDAQLDRVVPTAEFALAIATQPAATLQHQGIVKEPQCSRPRSRDAAEETQDSLSSNSYSAHREEVGKGRGSRSSVMSGALMRSDSRPRGRVPSAKADSGFSLSSTQGCAYPIRPPGRPNRGPLHPGLSCLRPATRDSHR